MTKFSKRLENTVGKGEIARYEQYFKVLIVMVVEVRECSIKKDFNMKIALTFLR